MHFAGVSPLPVTLRPHGVTRLGVTGGTFDPIHNAHLRLAEEARERFALDSVLFIPAFASPFKVGKEVAPGEDRALMLDLAVADNPAFHVSRWEIARPSPSYTVDTLRAIRDVWASANLPAPTLFFITGTDAAAGLARWREPEAILEMARFVVGARPGDAVDDVRNALPEAWRERIAFMDLPQQDIAATDLRRRVAGGLSLRYLTPRLVEEYIAQNGLYRRASREDALPVADGRVVGTTV